MWKRERKCGVVSGSMLQKYEKFRVPGILFLNLCPCKWLKPSLSLNSILISTGLWIENIRQQVGLMKDKRGSGAELAPFSNDGGYKWIFETTVFETHKWASIIIGQNTIFYFSKRSENIVFPKTLYWNMIFLVLSGLFGIVFLYYLEFFSRKYDLIL